MKALILSGGTGSRLRPLTYTNAKQLIPVANKPILFYIIEKVVNSGITEIGIIVGDTCDEIKSTVGNGENWNANITYIYQPLPLGLAHAVKVASSFLCDSDFIMILGDNLFKMDLDILIETFYSTDSNACILLHRVDNPQQYGVAVVENGRIIKLVEKPTDFISDLAITGVYVFDKSIFPAIDRTKPSLRGELEITDSIQELLNIGGTLTFELTRGWWKDTGKQRDLLEANRLVLGDMECTIQSCHERSSTISGMVQTGKSVTIENSIIRGPAIIGDNAVIVDSYIGPYTALGNSTVIRNCELENSIVLANSTLDSIDKRVDGSLIGKNVTIKGKNSKPTSVSFLLGDNSEVCL